MKRWSEVLYNTLNVYERNVFGCFFDIYRAPQNRVIDSMSASILWMYCKWQRCLKREIYLKYLEVPITTRCSLNCKECNNLIQVYQKPDNFDMRHIVQDIKHVCCVSKKIRMLRILGGEPLLHPDLGFLLKELAQINNIECIRIVTNGTLLFDQRCISLLENNPKFSVYISNYGERSVRYNSLISQLEEKRICYITQNEQKSWKEVCNCGSRGRSLREKKKVFSLCHEDCHSLLNGELHICPRSSHGTDLKLIPKKRDDFVSVRKISGKAELRRKLYELLNTTMIEACDYCDMFQINNLQSIPSAEQITKLEGMELMNQWREESRKKIESH